MRIANQAGPVRIGMIGMPRAGTTIMSAVVGSLDGALIVGEPHAMLRAQRPAGLSAAPLILETRHGVVQMAPGYDVLGQLETVAEYISLENDNITIVGFKECWVTVVEPIALIKNYGNRLTHSVVMIREPRTNYASIHAHRHVIQGVSPAEFSDKYIQLVRFALDGEAGLMIYEKFIKDPLGETMRATGFEIEGDLALKKYTGGGDTVARGSTEVRDFNLREPLDHPDLVPAIELYEEINAGP